MSGEKKPIIQLRGIVKTFYIGQPNELEILHGIDLDVYEGEFVAIVGESGSGKSTLMNIVGALDKPTQGSYWLDGIDMTAAKDSELSALRCRKIGFVFQTFNLIGRTSALKNVELPMLYNGVGAAKRTARARELLELVGMEKRMNHQPNELSGGQKQRVAIARALAIEPAELLARGPNPAGGAPERGPDPATRRVPGRARRAPPPGGAEEEAAHPPRVPPRRPRRGLQGVPGRRGFFLRQGRGRRHPPAG